MLGKLGMEESISTLRESLTDVEKRLCLVSRIKGPSEPASLQRRTGAGLQPAGREPLRLKTLLDLILAASVLF